MLLVYWWNKALCEAQSHKVYSKLSSKTDWLISPKGMHSGYARKRWAVNESVFSAQVAASFHRAKIGKSIRRRRVAGPMEKTDGRAPRPANKRKSLNSIDAREIIRRRPSSSSSSCEPSFCHRQALLYVDRPQRASVLPSSDTACLSLGRAGRAVSAASFSYTSLVWIGICRQ